jgi:hypothetical protein
MYPLCMYYVCVYQVWVYPMYAHPVCVYHVCMYYVCVRQVCTGHIPCTRIASRVRFSRVHVLRVRALGVSVSRVRVSRVHVLRVRASGVSRVSFETSFNSKLLKLEPKLVSALSEKKCLFRLFRFYTETESFDVSIAPKQTGDQPKQFVLHMEMLFSSPLATV